MKSVTFLTVLFSLATALTAGAQPSFSGPPPSRTVVHDASVRRAQYLQRINEALDWRIAAIDRQNVAGTVDLAAVSALLARHRDIELCNQRVIELMKTPGSGPFWMFPTVCVSFLGRDQLSAEAKAAIRTAWKSFQIRGDTENHWAMYYTSVYLMSELYPNDPAESWFNGKSSAENRAEARAYLISWMDLATTVGQGEYNPSHYIGEYAIPMMLMARWAQDPAMRQRGHMMLDWIFAGLAESTLNGVLHGPNSRTDEGSVVERWNALASVFSWVLFGNTPPIAGYGGWGNYFMAIADSYEVPAVIYLIATDRSAPFLQRDLARSRRRWRYSDELFMPVYKTNYTTKHYAVGSYQGGISDPIQTHVWDVTWDVTDPRGIHNTMFSLHPLASNHVLQMYFSELPDTMAQDITKQGKPSYTLAGKIVGCSPYEQVFQDLDTVVALYDIAPGVEFPQVNGFFSKDLINVTEDQSGWIFAEGGDTYLAYRPLAPYHWEAYRHFDGGWAAKQEEIGGRLLVSPHLKNGTIVQAASAFDFKDFEDFKNAIRRLPVEFSLEPKPAVKMMTLRGHDIVVTYGEAPTRDGEKIDYAKWKLFEGPYLNAEKNSKRLVITHGALQRVLDFNTLTIADTVTQP